jgi:hypothetical protein
LTPRDRGVLSRRVRIVEYLGGLTMVHVARHAEEPIVVPIARRFSCGHRRDGALDTAASGVHLFDYGGLRMAGGPP